MFLGVGENHGRYARWSYTTGLAENSYDDVVYHPPCAPAASANNFNAYVCGDRVLSLVGIVLSGVAELPALSRCANIASRSDCAPTSIGCGHGCIVRSRCRCVDRCWEGSGLLHICHLRSGRGFNCRTCLAKLFFFSGRVSW